MIEVCFAVNVSELLRLSAGEGASAKKRDLWILRCNRLQKLC